jgi:rSAM/selenodomain-associated transferase 1
MTPLPGPGARVLVVAKAPRPGRSKTRLVPPLTPEQAARLQEAMLLDTLETCRAEVPATGLLYADAGDEPALRALAGTGTWLVRQRGSGLADALRTGVEAGLADGDAVALVSADLPGVPAGALARTFAALAETVDVVIGPCVDGGYWLVGVSRAHELFEGIPWSTPDVLAATLERCAAAGLRVELVHRWRDLDTPADVAALRAQADRLPGRRTAELIRALAPG